MRCCKCHFPDARASWSFVKIVYYLSFKGSHIVQKKSSIKIEGFIKKEGPVTQSAVND